MGQVACGSRSDWLSKFLGAGCLRLKAPSSFHAPGAHCRRPRPHVDPFRAASALIEARHEPFPSGAAAAGAAGTKTRPEASSRELPGTDQLMAMNCNREPPRQILSVSL